MDLPFSLPSSLPKLPELHLPFNLPNLPFISGPKPQQQKEVSPSFLQIWGVFDQDTFAKIFDVDSMVDLKFSDTSKVASFPIEQGGFVSYDKVLEPFKPKIRLAVGGQKRIAKFMNKLSSELRSVHLYSISTPEHRYENVTLENYEYVRETDKGKNLLVADLTFRQIIQVQPQYATAALPPKKVKNPKSADKKVDGKTQPATPLPPPLILGNDWARGAELSNKIFKGLTK